MPRSIKLIPHLVATTMQTFGSESDEDHSGSSSIIASHKAPPLSEPLPQDLNIGTPRKPPDPQIPTSRKSRRKNHRTYAIALRKMDKFGKHSNPNVLAEIGGHKSVETQRSLAQNKPRNTAQKNPISVPLDMVQFEQRFQPDSEKRKIP